MKKYPRTMHLPWSPGLQNDDRRIETLDHLWNAQYWIITEKMDGENTTMTSEICHARSLDSGPHPSRTVVKSIWGDIKHLIPPNMRICGENMFAKHSIHYTTLQAYFQVFSVWQDDLCFSWDDTKLWAELLGLQTVPVLWEGSPDLEILHNFHRVLHQDTQEGFVIRTADAFSLAQFPTHVAKWVRAGHVQTDEHWMNQPVVKNLLKTK